MTTTCIQYSRPASGQTNSEIFGLDVAVNNLLAAYFTYSTQEKFFCRPSDIPSFEHFRTLAQAAGHPESKCIGLDPRHPKHNMAHIGCLFRPDPLIGDLIWQRQQVDGTGFATCGLVHTMSGERIAQAVGQLCLAPADGSDALICPSNAIRDAVQNLWQLQAEYYNHRFGGNVTCPIDTPVIPLGVNTAKFEKLTTADKRTVQRQALDATDDEVIMLFVGRMSFATKAHPLAMWQAAERVAKTTKKKIRLVMFGYYKPQDMREHFHKLAADVMKTVPYEFITNDDARFPDGLWAGSDIIISLSDNIQESFGLIPVEAMACGKAALISDWDGYRGSIRHSEDGFLVPTTTPPIAAGLDIAQTYFNEQNYGVALMGAAQSTAVDIDRCTEYMRTLVEDDALRVKMGANGRARAQSVFDWKHVIKAYEELWGRLADRRKGMVARSGLPPNWQAAHPNYPNPFFMFQSFPSSILSTQKQLRVVMSDSDIRVLMGHEMNYFIPELLAPQQTMMELVTAIRKAVSPRVADVLSPFPPHTHAQILRCVGWMLKHGVATVL